MGKTEEANQLLEKLKKQHDVEAAEPQAPVKDMSSSSASDEEDELFDMTNEADQKKYSEAPPKTKPKEEVYPGGIAANEEDFAAHYREQEAKDKKEAGLPEDPMIDQEMFDEKKQAEKLNTILTRLSIFDICCLKAYEYS
jgi:hypothetical protein